MCRIEPSFPVLMPFQRRLQIEVPGGVAIFMPCVNRRRVSGPGRLTAYLTPASLNACVRSKCRSKTGQVMVEG